MNDSNTLRTQYVDALIKSKNNLTDILNMQGIEATQTEGLNTLIPKVEQANGVPTIKHYCFSRGDVNHINETLNKISLVNQESLKACFANCAGTKVNVLLDLSNLDTSNAVNLDYMLAGPVNFKLGKGFILTKAESLEYFVSGGFIDNGSSSAYMTGEVVRDCTDVKKQIAPNVKSLKGFMQSGSGYSWEFSRKMVDFLETFFDKIHFTNKELNASNFFNGNKFPTRSDFTEEDIENFKKAFINIGNSLEYVINMSGFFRSCDSNIICLFANCLNYKYVKNLSYAFAPTSNTYDYDKYCGMTGYVLDFSNSTFDCLEDASSAFSSAFTYNSRYWTLKLGEAKNGTLKTLSQMFYSDDYLRTLDMSKWNLSNVNNISNIFYKNNNLKNLYFGYNLGKGYSNNSANTYGYWLDLSYCSILKKECVIDMFNKLYDLNITYGVYDEEGNPGTGTLYTQQIKLHANVKAQLTPEEIAIATNKGWTVV